MEAAGNIEPDNATFIFGDCGCASVRSCRCRCQCRHCFAAKAHDDEVLGMARKFFMRHDTFCAAAAAILCVCLCVRLSLATFAVGHGRIPSQRQCRLQSSIEMIFGCMEAVWLAARQAAY